MNIWNYKRIHSRLRRFNHLKSNFDDFENIIMLTLYSCTNPSRIDLKTCLFTIFNYDSYAFIALDSRA